MAIPDNLKTGFGIGAESQNVYVRQLTTLAEWSYAHRSVSTETELKVVQDPKIEPGDRRATVLSRVAPHLQKLAELKTSIDKAADTHAKAEPQLSTEISLSESAMDQEMRSLIRSLKPEQRTNLSPREQLAIARGNPRLSGISQDEFDRINAHVRTETLPAYAGWKLDGMAIDAARSAYTMARERHKQGLKINDGEWPGFVDKIGAAALKG